VGDPPDVKLIVFTPLEDEDTIRKLDWLLRDLQPKPAPHLVDADSRQENASKQRF